MSGVACVASAVRWLEKREAFTTESTRIPAAFTVHRARRGCRGTLSTASNNCQCQFLSFSLFITSKNFILGIVGKKNSLPTERIPGRAKKAPTHSQKRRSTNSFFTKPKSTATVLKY
jgi:hypothetical protein